LTIFVLRRQLMFPFLSENNPDGFFLKNKFVSIRTLDPLFDISPVTFKINIVMTRVSSSKWQLIHSLFTYLLIVLFRF